METESDVAVPEQLQIKLLDVLRNLETEIQKQNSLKRTFIKGAVYGLGTVLGATVLVALFGGITVGALNIFTDDSTIPDSL